MCAHTWASHFWTRYPSETHAVVNGNGSSGDLEVMKQEILREMRKEINKAKQEIIDGEMTYSPCSRIINNLVLFSDPIGACPQIDLKHVPSKTAEKCELEKGRTQVTSLRCKWASEEEKQAQTFERMSLSELARKRAFQNSLLLLPFVEICSSPGGFDRKTVRNRVAIYTTHIYSGPSANASFWNINTIIISIIVWMLLLLVTMVMIVIPPPHSHAACLLRTHVPTQTSRHTETNIHRSD